MNLYISNQDIVSLDISEINELDYYSSKLCFLDNCIEDCKNSVNIKYGDSLYYDEKKDIYCLPADIDEYQRCFLYRVVMDCIQVRRGNLPIHAPCRCYDTHRKKNSSGPKSRISRSRSFPEYHPLGSGDGPGGPRRTARLSPYCRCAPAPS